MDAVRKVAISRPKCSQILVGNTGGAAGDSLTTRLVGRKRNGGGVYQPRPGGRRPPRRTACALPRGRLAAKRPGVRPLKRYECCWGSRERRLAMSTTSRRVARALGAIVLAAGIATSLEAAPRQAVPRAGGAGPRVASPTR